MRPAHRVGAALAPWRTTIRAEHALAWSDALEDPNPLHRDADAVARLGLGERPINPGPASIAYFYNMLAESIPGGEVASLDARLSGVLRVGDTAEVAGVIDAVETVGDHEVLRCTLTIAASAGGPPLLTARAEIRCQGSARSAAGAASSPASPAPDADASGE